MLHLKRCIISGILILGDTMKKIQTNDGKYEIYSLYEGRQFTGIFSCENNCLHCKTICDVGLTYRKLIHQDVGA